jgi:hypothetical protein
MNKLITGIIIGLIIAGIIASVYFGFYYYKVKYYNNGLSDGQSYIIKSISLTGNIPYFDNSTGNITIKGISINNLCSQLNEREEL